MPGDTLPTTTIVPVGEDGSITVANQAGTVQLLADLVAVLPASVGRAVTPARLYDSRTPDARIGTSTRRPTRAERGACATRITRVRCWRHATRPG